MLVIFLSIQTQLSHSFKNTWKFSLESSALFWQSTENGPSDRYLLASLTTTPWANQDATTAMVIIFLNYCFFRKSWTFKSLIWLCGTTIKAPCWLSTRAERYIRIEAWMSIQYLFFLQFWRSANRLVSVSQPSQWRLTKSQTLSHSGFLPDYED